MSRNGIPVCPNRYREPLKKDTNLNKLTILEMNQIKKEREKQNLKKNIYREVIKI